MGSISWSSPTSTEGARIFRLGGRLVVSRNKIKSAIPEVNSIEERKSRNGSNSKYGGFGGDGGVEDHRYLFQHNRIVGISREIFGEILSEGARQKAESQISKSKNEPDEYEALEKVESKGVNYRVLR